MRARAHSLAILAVVAATAASAQVIPEPELFDRLINLPTHLVLPTSTIQLLFTHRFSQTVSDGGGSNLYGLDSAADIGIGLGVGLGYGLDFQVYRSSFEKELEGAFKWTALRQGTAPFGLAVRAGGEYRLASGITDRWAGFGQLVLAYRLGVLDLFAVPTYVSDTPTLRHAKNVGFGASLHLPHAWDISAEGIPANRDVTGAATAWAVGFVKRVRGHQFLIYVGNSRATTTDLIAGSDIPGGFNRGDVRLGFNLIRRFPE